VRLYLSSFKLGKRPDRLVALIGSGKAVAVIMNALDNFPADRAKWFAGQVDALAGLGLAATELDLRHYLDRPDALASALERVGAVWINGGNAFLLRSAMRRSGFDEAIHTLLAADSIVYAGFSAAVCCAGPTLRGVELLDDPGAVGETYGTEIVWDGLTLIDRNIIVHHKSAHRDSPGADRQVQYCRDHDIACTPISDGEAFVVDGETTEIVR
jgi:dipeptidase E